MDFKVGERVRFLHERQEGVVQEIINENKIVVLVDDFLDVEVSPQDIVHIHGAERHVKGSFVETGPRPEELLMPKEMSLAVCKNSEGNYDLLLINPGPDRILYTAFAKIRITSKSLSGDKIDAKKYKLIGQLSPDEFHHTKTIQFQILYFPQDQDSAKQREQYEYELLLRMRVTESKPTEIKGLKREGYLFELRDPEPKQEEAKAAQKEKPDLPPNEVVDLHIQKLVTTITGMTPDEMLMIQLGEFNSKLDAALKHNMKRMIFVHGVGSGTLKQEIHEQLRAHERVSSFEMADSLDYGNGATVVHLT